MVTGWNVFVRSISWKNLNPAALSNLCWICGNEIASGDCELVVSHIVSTHTYKGVVALSATTSGTTIRLSESSYIYVHILSINSIVASSIIGLSGLSWHLWVVDISGLVCNSNRKMSLVSRHSFGTITAIDSGSNRRSWKSFHAYQVGAACFSCS